MNNPQTRHGGQQQLQHDTPQQQQQQQQQQQRPQNEQQDDANKITPELLVDALSGHEDGLLSIAERLMTHYDSGYDTMGEAIIDAFADVQKLFQHVVEAAHMEGAALERERGEAEWRKRMEGMGIADADGILYGTNDDDVLDVEATGVLGSQSRKSGEGGDDLAPTNPEEHRHEELIDQDVRDVLIDAMKRGQPHRDARRHGECRALYESACASASALLPVDSDHRGRLQLAVARAESMSADRACSILKYAMDDVLRSGLSLRRGKYPQMDIKERSDCVLSRPNPLRATPSRGYDVSSSWDVSNNFNSSILLASGVGDTSTSMVEQSAEEALNSLVEEMKEILAAPVYNLTPLQTISEKFWLALGEAKKSSIKKEERLEQALAKIKADFLLAREEYEEQLSDERGKVEQLNRQLNNQRRYHDRDEHQQYGSSQHRDDFHVPYSPNRPARGTASRSDGGSGGSGGGERSSYHFQGMEENSLSSSQKNRMKSSSSQSVISMGSEFAQRAKGLVHLLNCQGPGRADMGLGNARDQPQATQHGNNANNLERDDLNYDSRRGVGVTPIGR